MILGAHESIAGGLEKALYRGRDATCDTIQIFNKSNARWQARPLTETDIDRFLTAIDETGVSVACAHASYLINLASPDPALLTKSRDALTIELERCTRLGIAHLVIHPGAHVGSGEEAGLHRISESINAVLESSPDNTCCVCLETTAGQGSTLGHTFEHLAAIIGGVKNDDMVSICLDTCHVFAAGYDLATREGHEQTMRTLEQVVGLDRLAVIHLNDSKTECGSHKDRHEHIGKGHIGQKGFGFLVNDNRLQDVPMILETPKGDDLAEDRENLRLLRSLRR